MSMPDVNDDALLGDIDELDYDLEKDEEEALLADPDNENYDELEDQDDEMEEPAEGAEDPECDVLDIDATVALEEEEQEQLGYQRQVKQELNDNFSTSSHENFPVKQEEDYSDGESLQREHNRFQNERNSVGNVRKNNAKIPDSLDSVPVNQMNANSRNSRFQRGGGNNRGRGRGKQISNRGPVFKRVGAAPQESKTVLINPHFRGNVQVKADARLVWDANQKYNSPPVMQVGPYQNQFQQQVPVWNNQFNESPQNFKPQMNHNFQEPPPPYHHNEAMNEQNSRQIFGNQVSFNNQQNQMTDWCDNQNYNFDNTNQQDFRQRPNIANLMNVPPPNFNQQRNYAPRPHQQFGYENRGISPNVPKPFVNQHPNPMHSQPNYAPNQNYEQPFMNPNQFNPMEGPMYPPNQMNQPVYNQFPNQFNEPYPNQFPNPANYNQSFGPPPNKFGQPPFGNQYQQFGGRQQFNQSRGGGVRPRMQQNFGVMKSPQAKRRVFDNAQGNNAELGKKKRRSSDLANLHEVATVDTPDTTFTEEKIPENEDEETRAYRLKIEEQKKLREKILREKEERRKLAALKPEVSESEEAIAAQNLLNIVKDKIEAPPPQNRIPQNRPRPPQFPPNQLRAPQNHPNQIRGPSQVIKLVQPNVIQLPPKPKKTAQNPQNIVRVPQNRTIVNGTSAKLGQPQRIVTIKNAPNNRRVVLQSAEPEVIAEPSGAFLSTRKVINKDVVSVDAVGHDLIQTPVVTVSNLAAGTTEAKLRKLCQGLGPIQNVEMKASNRQATIRFKNIVSAHKFFKKYQRKMIDLSMIQVALDAV